MPATYNVVLRVGAGGESVISRPNRPRVKRGIVVGCLVAGLLFVMLGLFLTISARSAKSHLEAARAEVERAQAAAIRGDQAGARRAVRAAQEQTGAARSDTSGVLWRAAGVVPVAGDSLDAVHAVAREADVMSRQVLPALVSVATSLQPSRLRSGDGQVNLAAMQQAGPRLVEADAQVRGIRSRLSEAAEGRLPAFVAFPLDRFRRQIDEVSSTLATALNAVQLLPPMLGQQGARRYLVAFQNPAEARGTGGLLGAYGIAEAMNGTIRFTEFGVNNDLRALNQVPVDLGPDFTALYGDDPALWVNANLSPHFPYAAQLWLAMWERVRGDRLDGVIATDPVALSYLLKATGPITLPDGERISADNVVRKTLSEAYVRFSSNDRARQQYLVTVSSTVVKRLVTSRGDSRGMVDALARAATERRLLVYSTRVPEQRRLMTTRLAGALPKGPGPYAFVVVNNADGSKLDYYLDRRVSYSGGACSVGGAPRATRVTVALRTDLTKAAKLPDYVVSPYFQTPGQRNVDKVNVALYGAPGAALRGLTADGKAVGFTAGTEQSHPVFVVGVTLRAGEWHSVAFDLAEPATSHPAVVDVQPLVRHQKTSRAVPACRKIRRR